MTPRLSLYLDGLRVIAAFAVLLSHFAYPRFTRGDYLILRDLNLGSDAVVLFFVLSGLVIAYTSDVKDRTLGTFAFNRVTRLLSVVAPAIVLTLVFDRLGAWLHPEAYAGWWYNPVPVWIALLHGLTFTTEWGPLGLRIGTNGPFWSLSYEAAYYVLFAVALFTRGLWRLVLIGGLVLVVGLKVLALMPAWLVGVGLYHLLRREQKAGGWFLAVAPVVAYVLALAANVPYGLRLLTIVALGPETVEALRFSDEFLWNALIGMLAGAQIAGVARLMASGHAPVRGARAIRWLAGASFSLYLVHYPALQLFGALLPDWDAAYWRDAVLLGLTVGVCLAFAQAFERPLPAIRNGVRQMLAMVLGRTRRA